jgi:hypothetical protein
MRTPTIALALLALSACGSPEPAPTATPPPAVTAAASPAQTPHTVGQPVTVTTPDGTATLVLSEVRSIRPPADWGRASIVIAMVAMHATAGSPRFDGTAWALVLPDGTRHIAVTIASDHGLPGKALGQGALGVGGRARGLVAFDFAGTLVGCVVEYIGAYPPVTWVP